MSEHNYYELTATLAGAGFTVQVEGKGGQLDDTQCRWMRYTSTGQKLSFDENNVAVASGAFATPTPVADLQFAPPVAEVAIEVAPGVSTRCGCFELSAEFSELLDGNLHGLRIVKLECPNVRSLVQQLKRSSSTSSF